MKIKGKRVLGEINPISVSDFIGFANELLKRVDARILGEVSSLQVAANGHVYFSIKDKKKSSTLRCIIWKWDYQVCGVGLQDGMEIVVSGHANIYAPNGSLSFRAETIELVGEGALKKAYDELKEKLSKEGLFEKERKKIIPKYPSRIGVITSLKSGTVIHDFVGNLGKFGFKIKAMDSRVEGQEAIKDLISCVRSFKKEEIDVLVLIRGGGSLESLAAFDNEMLVREISNFPKPVIVGIGHHKDVTLVSMVADASESTPSAAAVFLSKNWEKLKQEIDSLEYRIENNFCSSIENKILKLKNLSQKINNKFVSIFEKYKEARRITHKNILRLEYEIQKIALKIKNSYQSICQKTKKEIYDQRIVIGKNQNHVFLNFKKTKELAEKDLNNFSRTIFDNNPKRQLELGYSITKINGKTIKSIKKISVSDEIETQLIDGLIGSKIKSIKKNE